MKIIVATRILNDRPELKHLVNQSEVTKIAVNHACIKADYRVFSDYDKWYEYNSERYLNRGEKLITSYGGLLVLPRHIWLYYKPVNRPSLDFDHNDVLLNHKKGNAEQLFYYGGSLIVGVDLATRLGASEILIIGDNKVYYEKFQEDIKKSIDKLKTYAKIYCFKADNNFGLPYKDVEEFFRD